MKFKLQIELGNDAMKSLNDIVSVLDDISQVLAYDESDEPEPMYHVIRDENGNNVGSWKIE